MAKSFTITLDKKVKNLLSNTDKGFVAEVRREFSKRGPVKVKQAIVQDMIKGISPVKGQGKWQKYSDSYKQAIRGTAAFRTINGKVVPFTTKGISGKGAAKRRRTMRTLIAKLNQGLAGKRISPVNLRVTGDLHRSLISKVTGGFLRSWKLKITFKSKLADIHNRLGAGKSKVVRRMLPTKDQERFNNRITNTLLLELQKAADKVAQKFSGQ